VGLESPTDICADLQRGLNQSGTASVSG
jgi:cystathionine beta-lyase/cystathionine gamma-synthase